MLLPTEQDYVPSAAEKDFSQKGLDSNKRLLYFDCFVEETSPQEWVQHCQQQEGPHANVPVFRNGE